MTARLAILSALAAGACAPQTAVSQDTIVAIRSGTSFGHCAGYCVDQLDLTDSQARYERTAWPREGATPPPPLVTSSAMTPSRWASLVALARRAAIAPGAQVVGCPDCADGGAEWIEVETTDGAKSRVTFEHKTYPDRLRELGAALASIRAELAKQLKTPTVAAFPSTARAPAAD